MLDVKIEKVLTQPWKQGHLTWKISVIEEGTGKTLTWFIPKGKPVGPFLKGLRSTFRAHFPGQNKIIQKLCNEFLIEYEKSKEAKTM